MNTCFRRLATTAALLVIPVALLEGCSAAPEEAVNPSTSEALSMPPCGTVLGSFDGTDAHSNGIDTSSGYSCAGLGQYGLQYQCVELVMRHFRTHWNLSWSGNAKDLLNNAPKSAVDVYSNGDGAHPPVPGDMIVWPNGSYGHVALVVDVRSNAIDILEQNVKGSGRATLSWDGKHIGARWGNWVPSGWAHAKSNGAQNDNNSSNNGLSWDCGKSAYNGAQYWTCSGGNVYRCQSGVAQETTCTTGCRTGPVGTDDTCNASQPPPQVTWDCNKSAYNGAQYWTCSGGDVYRCQSGVAQETKCSMGCKSNPVGTDDVCL